MHNPCYIFVFVTSTNTQLNHINSAENSSRHSQNLFTSTHDCAHVQESPIRLIMDHCPKLIIVWQALSPSVFTTHHKIKRNLWALNEILKQRSLPKVNIRSNCPVVAYAKCYLIVRNRLATEWVVEVDLIISEVTSRVTQHSTTCAGRSA